MTAPTLLEPSPEQIYIPAWVRDLASFRRWTYSVEFPDRGLIAYFHGDIWVDLSREELFTHNRVKMAFTGTLGFLAEQTQLGSFVLNRMRWSHTGADLSTEPDGLFYTWTTLQSDRLRFVKGAQGGIIELEGTADMVLEIVSPTSVKKDTVELRDLYWRAGVSEYWLVDARSQTPQFQILKYAPTGYDAAESQDGWLASAVFGCEFRLTRHADPLGNPLYKLETR